MGPTPWMQKVKPSAPGLVVSLIWKLNWVLKLLMLTALVEKVLAASAVPPSVSCRAEPLSFAEPLSVSVLPAEAKPPEKLKPPGAAGIADASLDLALGPAR